MILACQWEDFYSGFMIAEKDLHPLQIAAWRKMTPQAKWDLAKSAQRMVINAARRRIKRQHPELDEKSRREALSRFLIRART